VKFRQEFCIEGCGEINMSTIKKRHLLFTSLMLVIISFVGVIGVSYYISKKFLFRHEIPNIAAVQVEKQRQQLIENHGAVPVSFKTSDNHELAGLLLIRPRAEKNILAAHGYQKTKEYCWQVAELFPDDNILLFDFRAHGQSTGDLISIGYHERTDIIAGHQFLISDPRTQHLPIVGIGFSMGAAALIGAAAQGTSFSALIVDSSFDQLDKQIARAFYSVTGLPNFPFLFFCQQFFSWWHGASMADVCVTSWAQQVTAPVLFIHSLDDTFTPHLCSQELFEKTSATKHCWFQKGAEHARLIKQMLHDYRDKVHQFLKHIAKL
jgi:uncharacterized protein